MYGVIHQQHRLMRQFLFYTVAITVVTAIPIDNGVEGEPEIECGPTSITINFNTRNPFEGHVYVKGLYDQPGCRNDEGGRQIDRAYRIQCFYMEADKTVSAQIEVSELTTAFQTAVVPMPVCRYEILEGGPTGAPIQFATIGQQVYHKWTCDSETTDTFCAVVHSCTVDDGNGDTIQILNEDGCALDKFLLNNLEYPTDLMAGQEAHVYKYADRSQLFYQCQISISIKEPNSECPRPQCAEPQGFGALKGVGGQGPTNTASTQQARLLRKRRSSQFEEDNTMDVRAELSALDISEKNNSELPSLTRDNRLQYGSQMSYPTVPDGVCISAFALFSLVAALLVIVAAFTAALTFSRRNGKHY